VYFLPEFNNNRTVIIIKKEHITYIIASTEMLRKYTRIIKFSPATERCDGSRSPTRVIVVLFYTTRRGDNVTGDIWQKW
jgi:hypothetical protein